jgi:hypothetical protein
MDARKGVDTEETRMSQLGDGPVARPCPVRTSPSLRGKNCSSRVFARASLTGAGSPLPVVLGVLLLIGCADLPIPEHAYSTGGSHWRCERGFRPVEGECQRLELPEHAFLSRSGNDWTCDRGFKLVQDKCQSVEVPEHAFLSRSGDSWKCDRGFERIEDKCQFVGEPSADLPEHAYMDFGRDWKCERGFERINEECRSVEVPEHAFLNYNADDWSCERGYNRADGECRSLEIPEHAYLVFRGNEWACDRGLKRDGERCSLQ